MRFLLCELGFGLQIGSIGQEGGIEGDENFWVELLMSVNISSKSYICEPYFEGICMPRNTRPRLDDILASLEDISTLDDQLEFRFLDGGLTNGANDAAQSKTLQQNQRNLQETYTKLKSFQASFDVLWMIGTLSTVTFELVFWYKRIRCVGPRNMSRITLYFQDLVHRL